MQGFEGDDRAAWPDHDALGGLGFDMPTRATSAPPPHLEQLWGAAHMPSSTTPSDGGPALDGRWTPGTGLLLGSGDIRCDDDYSAFYRARVEAAGEGASAPGGGGGGGGCGVSLPPPLDGRTVYSDLPPHLRAGLVAREEAAARVASARHEGARAHTPADPPPGILARSSGDLEESSAALARALSDYSRGSGPPPPPGERGPSPHPHPHPRQHPQQPSAALAAGLAGLSIHHAAPPSGPAAAATTAADAALAAAMAATGPGGGGGGGGSGGVPQHHQHAPVSAFYLSGSAAAPQAGGGALLPPPPPQQPDYAVAYAAAYQAALAHHAAAAAAAAAQSAVAAHQQQQHYGHHHLGQFPHHLAPPPQHAAAAAAAAVAAHLGYGGGPGAGGGGGPYGGGGPQAAAALSLMGGGVGGGGADLHHLQHHLAHAHAGGALGDARARGGLARPGGRGGAGGRGGRLDGGGLLADGRDLIPGFGGGHHAATAANPPPPPPTTPPPSSGGGGGGGCDDLHLCGAPPAPHQFRLASPQEAVGCVLATARDQAGCRALQRLVDEGGPAAIEPLLPELAACIGRLMVDPFGNYLIQKVLDRASDDQRTSLLTALGGSTQGAAGGVVGGAAPPGGPSSPSASPPPPGGGSAGPAHPPNDLVAAALNAHGTRAAQKLVETLATRAQVDLATAALAPGVIALVCDANGNHVIQRCLQRLSPADAAFIHDAVGGNLLAVATHRHGCCVLQRCIDFADPPAARALAGGVAAHALALSQDPFGNYVVQYVLERGGAHPAAAAAVTRSLLGSCAGLATQKFASNVVEKCIKLPAAAAAGVAAAAAAAAATATATAQGGAEAEAEAAALRAAAAGAAAAAADLATLRDAVVAELAASPLLPRLLQDPYANYVVQSALGCVPSGGPLHATLMEAIRPHLPSLRGTPHGKRILARVGSGGGGGGGGGGGHGSPLPPAVAHLEHHLPPGLEGVGKRFGLTTVTATAGVVVVPPGVEQ